MRNRSRLLEAAYCVVAIVLGAVQAWPYRFQPSTMDIVSYLDIGDWYAHGRWADAINGYWNPLYSWILGVVMAVGRPSPRFEFPVAKAVDFIIFLLTLLAFSWLLRTLRVLYRSAVAAEPQAAAIPDWAWIVGGYTLFIWSSLNWITVSSNTPDMGAAALMYSAWALLLRLDHGERRFMFYPLFGALLAMNYFARTPMFVVSIVVLLWMVVLPVDPARRRGGLAAAVAFFALTLPFVAAMSHARGHFTIGDNGKLNHAWLANPGYYKIPNRHWQRGPEGFGAATHPSRVLWPKPLVAEFASPIGGTFPPWTDPSYWYEGLTYRFNAEAEWATIRNNLLFYWDLFGRWFLLVSLVPVIVAVDVRASARALARNTRYWAPAALGLLLYLTANDLLVQRTATPQPPSRYVAMFVVLAGLVTLFSARARLTQLSDRRRRVLAAGLLIVNAAVLVALVIDPQNGVPLPNVTPPWQIAAGLHRVGMGRGMRVATIGSPAFHTFWARLARVQIVAEVPEARKYWALTPAEQERVLGAVQRSGAQIVVTTWVPQSGVYGPWQAVDDTEYARLELSELPDGPD